MPSRGPSTISSTASEQEARFRRVFERLHAGHPTCLTDTWLSNPCRDARDRAVPPIVWSRRNGPWRRSSILWVGAAPGNAGGRGRGHLGAHGTRIPFGGDVAGANLDVLLGSVGLDRNVTFIAAAYNQLPTRGGGEPALGELRSAVGDYPDSVSVLRDTVLAVGPRLIIALGNVAMRVTAGALRDASQIPTLRRLEQAGVKRGVLLRKPEVEAGFAAAWRQAWSGPLPAVLWLTHPSAQNMSPFAGPQTAFHQRMLAARRDLRAALRALGGFALPDHRAPPPDIGIYTLSEWRDHIAPVHARLDGLWRKHGV